MSYSPGIYNIGLYRGATLRQPFIRKVSRDGPAFNLTGYGAKATIRTTKIADLTPPILELNVGNGGIVIVGVEGRVEMFMPDTQVLSVLTGNRYYYDLFLIQPNADILPFMAGEMNFL